MISPYSRMKKRTSKQITHAGMTLATGMVFLPFIPLNKKSRWTTSNNKNKEDTHRFK